ncbi:MAG: hypothetical protein ACYTBJ_19235 [Planctomycetota bacterium]|jgi:hypothetical protein
MCIAIIKRRDNKLPTKKILAECWRRNSDGGGLAIWDEEAEVWNIKKGLMSFRKFWKELKTIPKDGLAFIHFRLATSGQDGHPGCTHPFPVTKEEDLLMELEVSCPSIVMHNGVIGQGEDLLSDTQVTVRDAIDLLLPLISDARTTDLLSDVLRPYTNRWVVSTGSTMYRWGDWKEDPKTNCLISKDLPVIYKKRTTTSNPTVPGGWYNQQEQQAYSLRNGGATSTAGSATGNPTAHTPLPAGLPVLNLSDDIFPVEMGDFASAYCDDKGNWDWSIWLGQGEPKVNNMDCTTVFDEDGKEIGLVDNTTGETVWADDEVNSSDPAPHKVGDEVTCPHCDSVFELYTGDHGRCPWCRKDINEANAVFVEASDLSAKDCPECGNPVTLASMTHKGECPWCMTELKFGDGHDEFEDLECPSCGEEYYLADSPWNCGDTICKKCGAVFTDDTREIVVWDLEIARDEQAKQEALYESH